MPIRAISDDPDDRLPTVHARCAVADIEIEVWRGLDETTAPAHNYIAMRILQNDRDRLWLMLEPDEWEQLRTLVAARLNEPVKQEI